MFKDNSQKRLLEVVQKLDARDNSKLNEAEEEQDNARMQGRFGEEVQYPSSDEYKSKVEKIKQTMDTLFNDEYYDVIDTLFKLLVSREKGSGQIASLSEDLTGRFNFQHNLTNDDTRDISINIVDKLVADGIVPDDMNTDNENEFRTQDIVHGQLNQVFNIQNQ